MSGLTALRSPQAACLALVATLLVVSVPGLLVQDSWLTLVSGREIVHFGLPHADHLTTMAAGRTWIDQQWLAQLLFYGISAVGGLKAVLLLQLSACCGAYCGPMWWLLRRRKAAPILVLAFALLALASAPWALQVRAQGLALVLFAVTLLLLLSDPAARRTRTLFVIPVLCIWANVHGSVILGAAIVSGYALLGASRPRSARDLGRRAALLLLPPLTLFASPYGVSLAGYYRLMILDPPFAGHNVEWQRTMPSSLTTPFFVLLTIAVVILATRRSRYTAFNLFVLALTLIPALAAVRGIPWFALAALAVLPSPASHRSQRRARQSRASTVAAAASVTVFLVALGSFLLTPLQADRRYPGALAESVARVAGAKGTVFADDAHADWLLWKVPSLRGRIAYDVRFELLSRGEVKRLDKAVRFDTPAGVQIAARYDVTVGPSRYMQKLRKGQPVYNDGTTTVLLVR